MVSNAGILRDKSFGHLTPDLVDAVAPAAATRMNARLLGERAALLSPDAIAPVVAFLAHRDCAVSGQILSVCGGHVSAVLLSVTRGITDPLLSAETVRDRLARTKPAPDPRVPIVIGGKGDVAVRRAARYGDGCLAIFCSARRFAQTKEQIGEAAAALDRPAPPRYGINVWCGLDADAAQARRLLASQLEGLYHLPFGKFERLAPADPPVQVAEALAPYRAAGAAYLTLVPAAASPEAGVEHAAAVRALLNAG